MSARPLYDRAQMVQFHDLLPRTHKIAIAGFTATGHVHHAWIESHPGPDDTADWIAGAVDALAGKGAQDFYFSPAGFKFEPGVPPRRRADFAHRFRAYYVDLDCHGGADQYADPQEAYADLTRVCAPLDIMPTHVVMSGRGLHAYWALDRDITTHRWQNIADDLWSVLRHFGLRADPSCRRDRARVLRLPGTINTAANRRAVFVHEGAPYSFATLYRRVQDLAARHGVTVDMPDEVVPAPSNSVATVFNDEQNEKRLAWLLSRTPSSFDDYATWRNVVWAAKRTGLPNAWDEVQKWAARSADKYDDLDEALLRTWDSDNEAATGAVGPGTLVVTARKHGRRADAKALRSFYFYTEEVLYPSRFVDALP